MGGCKRNSINTPTIKAEYPNLLVIYFTSEGGFVHYADYILNYLNRLALKFNIEIICSSHLLSSGLTIPLMFEGKVIIKNS